MGDDIGRNTAFYYNLKTHQVEEEGQSKAKDLLGPYPDRQSAANALQAVHDRELKLSEQDREWQSGQQR